MVSSLGESSRTAPLSAVLLREAREGIGSTLPLLLGTMTATQDSDR
jgi:hypothetical protein